MTQRRYALRTRIWPGLILLAALISPLRATLIDDFSTPQGPLSLVSEVVSGPGIVGGSRTVSAGFFFEVAGGEATFSNLSVSGGNVMSISYGGTSGSFPSPVDLTDGGTANMFLLGITGIESFFGGSVALAVTDVNLNTAFASFPFSSPGVYAAPLPTGLSDFTQVISVGMPLFLGDSTGATMKIDFACTGTLEAGCTSAGPATAVPEPGTAVLLVVGAAALGLMRKGGRAIAARRTS